MKVTKEQYRAKITKKSPKAKPKFFCRNKMMPKRLSNSSIYSVQEHEIKKQTNWPDWLPGVVLETRYSAAVEVSSVSSIFGFQHEMYP